MFLEGRPLIPIHGRTLFHFFVLTVPVSLTFLCDRFIYLSTLERGAELNAQFLDNSNYSVSASFRGDSPAKPLVAANPESEVFVSLIFIPPDSRAINTTTLIAAIPSDGTPAMLSTINNGITEFPETSPRLAENSSASTDAIAPFTNSLVTTLQEIRALPANDKFLTLRYMNSKANYEKRKCARTLQQALLKIENGVVIFEVKHSGAFFLSGLDIEMPEVIEIEIEGNEFDV